VLIIKEIVKTLDLFTYSALQCTCKRINRICNREDIRKYAQQILVNCEHKCEITVCFVSIYPTKSFIDVITCGMCGGSIKKHSPNTRQPDCMYTCLTCKKQRCSEVIPRQYIGSDIYCSKCVQRCDNCDNCVKLESINKKPCGHILCRTCNECICDYKGRIALAVNKIQKTKDLRWLKRLCDQLGV
jgi:hypothetical protein